MLAADTNVLVRLLVSDDRPQQRAVQRRLEAALRAGESVMVSPVALAEAAWVLESVYAFQREAIAGAVAALLDTPPVQVAERAIVQQALSWYRDGTAGLPDYLILAQAQALGARALLTFDRRLLRHPATERP